MAAGPVREMREQQCTNVDRQSSRAIEFSFTESGIVGSARSRSRSGQTQVVEVSAYNTFVDYDSIMER